MRPLSLLLLAATLAACPAPDDDTDTGGVDTDVEDTDEPVEGDPRLADLEVDGVVLRPLAFDPDTYAYSGTLAANADQATILATPLQQTSAVSIDGVEAPDGTATVATAYGENTIEVVSTDLDGGTATYTLDLDRPADRTLRLSLSVDVDTWEAGVAQDLTVTADVQAGDGIVLDTLTVEAGDLLDAAVSRPATTGRTTVPVRVEADVPGGTYTLRATVTGEDALGDPVQAAGSVEVTVEQEYVISTGSASFDSIAATGDRLLTSGSASYRLPFDVGLFGETVRAGTTLHPDQYGQVHVGRYSGAIVPGPTSRYRELVDTMWAVYHHSTAQVSGGGVYAQVQGIEPDRVLVLEWRGEYRGGVGTIQSQLRLFEDRSTFEIVYGRTTDDAFNPTQWSQFVFDGEREAVYQVPFGERVSSLQDTRFTYTWD